ncbi:hypothetical protein V2J09_009134 [Rumex salicifolius]
MGNNEAQKPSKSEKPSSPPQAQTPNNVHAYPDWAAVQAYYGTRAIPPPYFNPAVSSGHPSHPYMWAPPQMMPPYGSPYAAMYPHGVIYGHSPAPIVATPLTFETPTRSSGNDSGSAKKPKEPDAQNGSGNANAESAGEGGTQGQSQSTDSGTEGSDDQSDDSTARGEQNGKSYNEAGESGKYASRTKVAKPYPALEASIGNGVVPGMVTKASPIRMQDERELKREKRKQANRESARRSRLRRLAEMEELSRKVDALSAENMALKSEINKLVEDGEKLKSENAALVEKLNELQGEGKMVSGKSEDEMGNSMNTQNFLSKVENAASEGENGDGK